MGDTSLGERLVSNPRPPGATESRGSLKGCARCWEGAADQRGVSQPSICPRATQGHRGSARGSGDGGSSPWPPPASLLAVAAYLGAWEL